MSKDKAKNKIAQIISEYCCPSGKTHKQLYGDDRLCYSRMNFAECAPITECTDALISAGIGDVKDLQVQVDSLEITNIALQAGYDDAEKDRLYWVDKYKEAEHRAEVAEMALKIVCRMQENLNILVDGKPWTKEEIYNRYIEQAEKELAEESKDD